MNDTQLIEKLARTSANPGVYLMKDADGLVIYVGKAANLKKRISSYFKDTPYMDAKTGILVKKISAFETIVTETENEALLLESNLIKQYKPRYNIILKDDKRFPCLRLDIKSPYPALAVVRKPENDGAMYFGPFSSAQAVRKTYRFIQKTFKLRKCKTQDLKKRSRPCLNFQMGRCLGPCCFDVDQDSYQKMVKEVVWFLKGRTPELIRHVKQQMIEAAQIQDYENAAILRDKMFAFEQILEKQVSMTTDFMDRDIIGIAGVPELLVIAILHVRGGYLLGTQDFKFSETLSTDGEMIGAFIRQYYEKAHFIPKEILVPVLPEETAYIEEELMKAKGKKVTIFKPYKGERVRLLKMAMQNAEERLKDRIDSDTTNILERLKIRLGMERIPARIECLDNSNISGKSPVSGIVIFQNGKPDKSSYRKYIIKNVKKPDDYAYMAEVLSRRFGKVGSSMQFPDLLMVDGGKGQLNIALSIIRELNLEGKFDIIGIAKKDEQRGDTQDKIFKPGRANPIIFGKDGDLLFFLQRIRDEAHRFAITFHRKRRREASLTSALDSIAGIGKQRRKILLRHFGSVTKIRAATIEELALVPGISLALAKTIHQELSSCEK